MTNLSHDFKILRFFERKKKSEKGFLRSRFVSCDKLQDYSIEVRLSLWSLDQHRIISCWVWLGATILRYTELMWPYLPSCAFPQSLDQDCTHACASSKRKALEMSFEPYPQPDRASKSTCSASVIRLLFEE